MKYSPLVKGIKNVLPFLGPSLILAVSLSGRGYIDLLSAGANFGFSLLWVILCALLFKYAIVDGITRYTLATGEHIFAGLRRIPGPENWEIVFIMFIYMMEMVGYGGLTLSCALFLGYLLPVSVPRGFIAIILVLIFILLLYRRSYKLLERLALLLVLVMTLGMAYLITAVHIPWIYATGPWSNPIISPDNLPSIVSLFITVGSGLSLLFSSIWLQEKIGTSSGREYYIENQSAMRTGNIIAFLLVGLFSIGLVIIGFGSFEGETIYDGLMTALGSLPHGLELLILISVISLFGTILMAVDGRARAISRVLSGTINSRLDEKSLYRILLFLLSAVMVLVILLGNPFEMVQWVLAIADVMFAITGFMLLYLDLQLPSWARGNPIWIAIMACGSGMYLLIALLKEEFFLKAAIPLLEGIIVVLFLLYIFMRTEAFKNAMNHHLNRADYVWIIIFCSAISIYGNYRGVNGGGFIINFRDFGVMIAGLIGGPVAGVCTGIVGGAYRYTQGGWTTIPCLIGTISAGFISGFLAIKWRYKMTYLRLVVLAIIVESFHILMIIPIYSIIAGIQLSTLLLTIRQLYLPMIVTNAGGLVLFLYLLNDQDFSGIERVKETSYEPAGRTIKPSNRGFRIFFGVLAIMLLIGASWSVFPIMFHKSTPMIHIHYAGTRGDHAYTDTAYKGFLKAFSSNKFNYQDFTSFSLNESDEKYNSKGPDPDMIITQGFQYSPYSHNWSRIYPKTNIIAIDQYGQSEPNIRYEEITAYGSSYLAGVLASNMSKSGKVAVIGGTSSWLLDGFIKGFEDGVHAAKPGILVTTIYISNGTEGFYNEHKAQEIAKKLISEGNDVIFGVASYANIGMVQEAKQHNGVYIIGVDTDQSFLDPKIVAASVIKRIDLILSEGIDAELNKTFTSGTRITGLSDGYSDLSINHRFDRYSTLISSWRDRAAKAEEKYLKDRVLPVYGGT